MLHENTCQPKSQNEVRKSVSKTENQVTLKVLRKIKILRSPKKLGGFLRVTKMQEGLGFVSTQFLF